MAYNRMRGLVPSENILVVTLKEYRDLVMNQLPEVPADNILLEMYNRDTAPCIMYAATEILHRDPDAVMIAAPADHVIADSEEFRRTMDRALDFASRNRRLLTLGIVPQRPDANFGYIQIAGGRSAIESGMPAEVKTFTEKPDKDLAQVFINSGEFLWNSGIFIWQASLIVEQMNKYAPEIAGAWKESGDIDKIYTMCPRVSIDYAVMEKTDCASVIPSRFGWADIGNWESLYSYLSRPDQSGNVTNISGTHLFREDSNNIIFSKKEGKLVAIRGLENMVVVDTDDVLMICPRGEKQIKDFISELAMPEFEDYR